MKSFNQFLQESYFSEEIPTGMSRDEFNRLPSNSKRKLTGSKLGIGNKGQTLNTSQNSPAVRRARNLNPPVSSVNSDKLPIPNPPKPPTSTPPSGGKPPTSTPPSGASSATKTATKTAGKGILRGAGKLIGPASAAIDVADERSKGSGWARSLAKGAVVAAGGALGGAAGTAALPGLGTVVGSGAGSIAASKAFDVAAGKNARERAADRMANRQKQAGGAIKGIGGKTTFDTKKNTITTGTGPQKRTAQLGKTSVITGPGGKQEVGHLAYKGGKAVYKRASATGSDDGIFARIRRAVDPSGARQSDAANAAKKLATARQSDAARNKALGVKFSPGK